jgi:phosphohistidine swiveling domain-containing protein
MKYVHELKDNCSSRLSLSGGKGANLHKLIRYGFSVPDGFVINTRAFDEFLKHNNLSSIIKKELSSVRVDNHDTISLASNNIKREIIEAEIPGEVMAQVEKMLWGYDSQRFAVRSSGVFEDSSNNSWAGQFDSFLQINKSDLIANVKKCWASLFNPRAISYNISAYKNFDGLKFAVVIQRMVASDKSGVAFSVEPHEKDFNKILIEATPGLGNDLVSGKEVPFTAVVDKKKKIILNKSFRSNKHKGLLEIEEIILLSKQVVRLEKQFNTPVDIEWSFDNKNLYFLQIRPITGLSRKNKSQKRVSAHPDISDYELTFKVTGLSFLFADMLAHGFKYLDPLFTSYESKFSQYFSNEKMEYAAKYGMEWLSKLNGFKDYEKEFSEFYNRNIVVLDDIITNKHLSISSCQRFFRILSKLFTYYSKTDNEFTNLTYIYSEENPVIKQNLHLLSKFKDHARVWINDTAIEESGQFSRFINRVCDDFSIPKPDLECYKVSEIAQLFNDSFVSGKELKKRNLSYTMFFSSGKQRYLTGDQSVEFINKVTARENLALGSEIKGQVANKVQKVIKGRVRIINVDYGDLDKLNQEMAEMEKGEILVSEFTAPELLAACRKAKAIVTDIGGMLSHAAIVSREFNIPCLVGTGNATKILKTGDLISIDFELGVVNKQ